MRHAVVLLAALLVVPAPAAAADDEAAVVAALDALGPLDGSRYDPRPVIRAVNLLQPLGAKRGVALLRRYVARRGPALAAGPPSALFAVLRTIFEPPPASGKAPKDACTPRQREVASGGCLRPPMLGAPWPPPPKDLRSLRYPIFVLGDIPLSLVSGYALGGHPEPASMHLEALAAVARWRAQPLRPQAVGEVRYLFVHYGQWSFSDPVGRMVDAQLRKMEAGDAPARTARAAAPCLDLGLWCVPRAASSPEAVRVALAGAPGPTMVSLAHGQKRVLVAFLEVPTDSESYIHVAAWSYTAHFREWRLFLLSEIYGAVSPSAVIDAPGRRLVIRNHTGGPALIVPLAHIPYSVRP